MIIANKPTRTQKLKLGEMVKNRRKKEIRQENFAEKLNCDTRWIQKVEAGQGNPNWITLLRMILILDISVEALASEVGINVPVSAY